MRSQPQIDQHLLAIEVTVLRVAEIATLRRECAFWRERCRMLEAVMYLPPHKVARRARQTQCQRAEPGVCGNVGGRQIAQKPGLTGSPKL